MDKFTFAQIDSHMGDKPTAMGTEKNHVTGAQGLALDGQGGTVLFAGGAWYLDASLAKCILDQAAAIKAACRRGAAVMIGDAQHVTGSRDDLLSLRYLTRGSVGLAATARQLQAE